MLAAERRNLILEKVYEDKKVIVSELSREFKVSEETIRRDLEKLAGDGHVIKGYGGAVINEKTDIDLPFNVRWKYNAEGKKKIADLVKREIEDGDHIILDASTTAVFIAKSIKQKKRLTVITNSIENMLELSGVSGWDIISTGGVLNSDSMSLIGKKAAEEVMSYNADKLFLSCRGLDLEKGITDGNDEIVNVKQKMIQSAAKVYLAADSSKFGKVAFSQICSIKDVDVIITDRKPEKVWLDAFKEMSVECVYPD